MRIELIPAIGGPPVVLDVSQYVVRNIHGTPIAVGATYGPDGADAVSCVSCADFERLLRALGVHTTVIVQRLEAASPQPGAVLLAGPK